MPGISHYQSLSSPSASCLCFFFSHPSFSYFTTTINGSICFSLLPSRLSPLPEHILPSLPPHSLSLSMSPFPPPTPIPTLLPTRYYLKSLSLNGGLCSLPGGDLQASCGTLDEGGLDDTSDWEEEREMERLACEGDDFIPPKIMVGGQDCNKVCRLLNQIQRSMIEALEYESGPSRDLTVLHKLIHPWEKLFDMYLDFLVWCMAHEEERGLLPVMQPATRGQSRWFEC